MWKARGRKSWRPDSVLYVITLHPMTRPRLFCSHFCVSPKIPRHLGNGANGVTHVQMAAFSIILNKTKSFIRNMQMHKMKALWNAVLICEMSHFTLEFVSSMVGSVLEFLNPCSILSTFLNSEIIIVSGSLSLRFVYLCLSTKLKPSTKNGLQFLYSHHSWVFYLLSTKSWVEYQSMLENNVNICLRYSRCKLFVSMYTDDIILTMRLSA